MEISSTHEKCVSGSLRILDYFGTKKDGGSETDKDTAGGIFLLKFIKILMFKFDHDALPRIAVHSCALHVGVPCSKMRDHICSLLMRGGQRRWPPSACIFFLFGTVATVGHRRLPIPAPRRAWR